MRALSFLVGVSTVMFVGSAIAADSTHTRFDWSGAYVGASIGFGSGSTGNSWRNDGMTQWEADGKIKYRSLLGGGYIGVQQQFGSAVVGLEADYNWMNFQGDDRRSAGFVNGLELNSVGTARARLGWALDRSLFYVTGGLAYGEITKSDRTLLNTEATAKAVGWTAGVGAESVFTNNWIGRISYQYTDLGEAETFFQDPSIGSYSHRANNIAFHSLQIGLGYKF